MRPCRTGTRSGSRVMFCSSSSATGSARSTVGAHSECAAGDVCSRAAFPNAFRCSTFACAIFVMASLPCDRVQFRSWRRLEDWYQSGERLRLEVFELGVRDRTLLLQVREATEL